MNFYFLIPTVSPNIFNSTVELAIPIDIPTKEAKTEMETNAATAEAKISKCSI